MRLTATAALAALSLTPLAAAQTSVFVDLGPAGVHGAPSAPFSAAASVSGVWNEVDTTAISAGPFPFTVSNLVDLSGAPSGVSILFADLGTGFEGFAYDDPATQGGDDALLDDLGFFGGGALLAIRGLPAGAYELYTYASVPDGQDHVTRVMVPISNDPAQDVTGGFANGYQAGATHALHHIVATAGVDVLVRLDVVRGFMSLNGLQVVAAGATGPLGSRYCSPAAIHSGGGTAEIAADGSPRVVDNDVTLHASVLPPSTFGYFITSRDQGLVAQPGGSMGILCLGGSIGRYRAPGQIMNSGPQGEFSLQLDLGGMPSPTGLVAVVAGETWNFQCWFRDAVLFIPTSNFTDALSLTFN